MGSRPLECLKEPSSLSSSTFHLQTQLPMFFPDNNWELIGKRAQAAFKAEPDGAPKNRDQQQFQGFYGTFRVGMNRACRFQCGTQREEPQAGESGTGSKDGIQTFPKIPQDDPTLLQGLLVGKPRGWEGYGMKDWDEAHGKIPREGNTQDLLPVESRLNSFPGVEFPLFPALSADGFHENLGEFVGILEDLGFPAHVGVSATLFPKVLGFLALGKRIPE